MKSVVVRRYLRPGTVVFARLLESDLLQSTYPIGYRVKRVRPTSQPGLYWIELGRLRASATEEPVSGIRVYSPRS